MTQSEVMDIARALSGRPDVDPILLKFAFDEGRREVERQGNFYWMATKVSKSLVSAQQSYGITTSGSNGFNLSDFKEIRYMFVKANSGGTIWDQVPVGSHADAINGNTAAATGQPEAAVIENITLWVYNIPDATYDVAFFYWAWTSNNTDITTATDEVYINWPMLMLSSAMAILMPMLTKNKEDAGFWISIRDDEVKKAKEFTNKRMKEPVNSDLISASEAARILQSQGAR